MAMDPYTATATHTEKAKRRYLIMEINGKPAAPLKAGTENYPLLTTGKTVRYIYTKKR
jgi:hypothetical protein